MALIQAQRVASGGGANVAGWQIDPVEETNPFSSGYAIPLSQTPVDASSLLVYSEGLVLYPDDWTYNAGTNEVEILFNADPATDTTDGTWHFFVQYPYT